MTWLRGDLIKHMRQLPERRDDCSLWGNIPHSTHQLDILSQLPTLVN